MCRFASRSGTWVSTGWGKGSALRIQASLKSYCYHTYRCLSHPHSLYLLSPLTFRYMERCYLNDALFRCFDGVRRNRELEKDTGDVFLILWQHQAPVGMPAKSGKKFCPGWGSNPRPSVWYARLLPLGHAAPQYTFRALTAAVGPKSKIQLGQSS